MNAPARTVVALAGLCLLAGCAQTGAPLPPSLELPKPPSDLRAVRKGDRITLTWSEPTLTTDRLSARYLGPTKICRSAEAEMTACGNAVEVVPPPAGAGQQRHSQKSQSKPLALETYVDSLPPSLQNNDPSAAVTYAVEVLNRNARGAGLSNRVHVPALKMIPPPGDLAATLTGDGVLLTWASSGEPPAAPGVEHRYRIYRRTEVSGSEKASGEGSGQSGKGLRNSKKDAIAGEVRIGEAGPERFLDAIEWEKTYLYWITAVTIISRPGSEVQVEGDDSAIVRVVAHDIFPPSVPGGLQAVYSGEGQKPFIDLIWAPVASADLAGYNVYRSEAGGATMKLNSELVKSPSYRDSAVSAGKTYTYSISAVDARGNESARSEEASETVR